LSRGGTLDGGVALSGPEGIAWDEHCRAARPIWRPHADASTRHGARAAPPERRDAHCPRRRVDGAVRVPTLSSAARAHCRSRAAVVLGVAIPRVAVIPGDGAGIEVAREALRILEAINSARNLGLVFEQFDFGAERFLKTGVGLPPGQIENFRENYDAILFDAVGDPRVKDQAHAREILLGLRFGLDLFINFRPCQLLVDRLSPLKGKGRAEIDFVVFRENTEGMYNG